MQNRETKEIQIGDHKVVLKTYATGREYNEIQKVVFGSAKINIVGGAPQFNSVSAEIAIESDKKAIEMLVVSIDGKTENILDTILDLRQDVYAKVVEEVNDILGKKK